MENKALGKGLSALISKTDQEKNQGAQGEINETLINAKSLLETGTVPVSTQLIDNNPFQPRKDYDQESLEELKASIKEKGILQPILVRPRGERFEVVAGERRLRAARDLNLAVVPVVVKQISDSEALLLALIENIQRQDLNVIDEAKAFARLTQEFQLSQEQIAQSVGKDRATVSNTLRLLKLPAAVQRHLIDEKISMGHARALLALDNEAAQLKMAQEIIKQNLSVRSVEGLVGQTVAGKSKKAKALKLKDQDILNLEEELRSILGTKVTVEDKKGRGKLVIEYYSLNDLDRVLEIIRKK